MSLLKNKSEFYHMMASMTQAGMPLTSALQQPFPSRLRSACRAMRAQLDSGTPLADAMKSHEVFTPFERNLVAIGSMTGTLYQSFLALGEWFQSQYEINSKIISGLLHPLLTYYIAAFILSVVDVFANGAAPVTAISKCVFLWLLPLIILLLYRLLSPRLQRIELYGVLYEAIPLFGDLRYKLETALFYKSLGLCLQSGLGMVQAVRLSATACRHENTRKKHLKIADMIEKEGLPFTICFQRVMSWRDRTSPYLAMLSTGETSGSFAEYALRISAMAHDDAQTLLTRIATIAPILVFIPLAAYIGYRVIMFYAAYIGQINQLLE